MEISAERRRQTLVGLSILFALLVGAFFFVGGSEQPLQSSEQLHTSTSLSSNRPNSLPSHHLDYKPLTFKDAAFAYLKVQTTVHWQWWVIRAVALLAAVVVVVIMWLSWPEGVSLFNLDNTVPEPAIDQENQTEDQSVQVEDGPFYEQPWFYTIMVYFGVSIVMMVIDLAVSNDPFLSFDTSSKPAKFISAAVSSLLYLFILPVYAVCVVVLGLFIKLARCESIPGHKVWVAIAFIFTIPFRIVLIALTLIRFIVLSLLSCIVGRWAKLNIGIEAFSGLGFIAANIYTPIAVFSGQKTLETNCRNIVENEPILNKLVGSKPTP